MADEHFSHEIIERFFRSQLSQGETRELVRHLLRQCRRCSWLLQQVARGQSFRLLVRGPENAALRFDPAHHPAMFERIARLAERKEVRPVQETARRRVLR